MASLELRDLCKTFRGPKGEAVHAVRHLNLSVPDKEFMVLVGPSGCGKTSTLRMIAGLEEITAGSIWIDGVSVNHVAPKDRDVAMVFQNYALFPHLTVFENMAFGLKLRRVPKPEIRERVGAVAELLGLAALLDRKPSTLSGGQRQRVAVGRAIVRRPRVFLFDEPLSNLDARMRVQLRRELADLHRRLEATMVYVTHDQSEAMALGHRLAVMHEGALQQIASPREIYEEPANRFVAGFVGTPPMNFLLGQLEPDGGALYFREHTTAEAPGLKPWRLPLPYGIAERVGSRDPSAVVLGLRPEHALTVEPRPESLSPGMVEALLERVETPGGDWYLHLRTAGHPFVARQTVARAWAPPQRVAVTLDTSHPCLLDAATGARLKPAGAG